MAPRLVRVQPRIDPGLRRRRRGTGFSYTGDNGRPAKKADLRRIDALVLPPAWTDVWICAHPRGHIQAVGTDAAGRDQYRYHDDWTAKRARRKFDRALDLAAALPRARAAVTADLRQDEDDSRRTLAVAFRFLDDAAPRIGSATYLDEHGTRGLTTLTRRNVAVDGDEVTLSFPGKDRVRNVLSMTDADLAAVVRELTDGSPRGRLLTSARARGRGRVNLTPADVNEYIRRVTGGRYTAKDFRTLRGTAIAAHELADLGPADTKKARTVAERTAVRAVAAALSNTPAVARGSYIDPRVFAAYAEGRVIDRRRSQEAELHRLLRG